MKIIITEQQFKKLVDNIINEKYPPETREEIDMRNDMEDDFIDIMRNVIEKRIDNYPNSIFYVDNDTNEIYMKYYQKTKHVYIDYIKLWSKFGSKYHLRYDEVQRFFKDMMSDHYNLRDITPKIQDRLFLSKMSEHYNLWGITPGPQGNS